jgi:hypothetical protein
MLIRETVLDQVVKVKVLSVQIIQEYKTMANVVQMFVTLTQ